MTQSERDRMQIDDCKRAARLLLEIAREAKGLKLDAQCRDMATALREHALRVASVRARMEWMDSRV